MENRDTIALSQSKEKDIPKDQEFNTYLCVKAESTRERLAGVSSNNNILARPYFTDFTWKVNGETLMTCQA